MMSFTLFIKSLKRRVTSRKETLETILAWFLGDEGGVAIPFSWWKTHMWIIAPCKIGETVLDSSPSWSSLCGREFGAGLLFLEDVEEENIFFKKFSSIIDIINISFRKFEKYRETYKEKYSCNLTAQRSWNVSAFPLGVESLIGRICQEACVLWGLSVTFSCTISSCDVWGCMCVCLFHLCLTLKSRNPIADTAQSPSSDGGALLIQAGFGTFPPYSSGFRHE